MLGLLVVFFYMKWRSLMNKVYIGKIVSTHGIKGELRLISDFPYKEYVFSIGNHLWIDNQIYTISSYRKHKQYDMNTLESFHDINEVLFLLKKDVYFDRSKLPSSIVLDSELLDYEVLTSDGKKGIIKEIFYASPTNKIVRIYTDREILVPFSFLEIHPDEKRVLVTLLEGM